MQIKIQSRLLLDLIYTKKKEEEKNAHVYLAQY
jgi:hypothetical protein